MLVAALDTATLTLSCALLEVDSAGATLLAEHHEPASRGPGDRPTCCHGARLPGVLTELLSAHGRRLPDLEGYAVGLGPGSFTGLRIGLATWKGLAYANRRPLAGASSLAAMALAAARDAGDGALLVPLLDAKKGEVYAGFYRRLGPAAVEAVQPDAALSPDALRAALSALPRQLEPLAFGEGLEAHQAALGGKVTQLHTAVRTPGGASVGLLAAPALRAAGFDAQAISALEPRYVRASEAEVKFPDGLPGLGRGAKGA